MKKILATNNYIVLKNFIPRHEAICLSNEFKTYCHTNNIGGDTQSPNSYALYNHVPFLEILCKKTNEISEKVEECVIPTYSYARVYLNNSILDKHTDRDACEISVTIHLDGDMQWPIFIKNPNNDVNCINLEVGDAMIYNGNIAEHWRETFPGKWYTQLFLHYVRSRGPCSYAYFDKQKNSSRHISNSKSSGPFYLDEYEYIYIKKNSMSDEFCDYMINFFEKDEFGMVRRGETVSGINPSKVTFDLKLTPNINKYDQYMFEELNSNINLYLNNIKSKYGGNVVIMNNANDSGYHIQKYKACSGFYAYHQDSCYRSNTPTGYQTRMLTFIWYLNTVDEGGETEFLDGKIKVAPEKGKLLIFPSTWTYMHRGNMPISNDKYIITGWLWVDIWVFDNS